MAWALNLISCTQTIISSKEFSNFVSSNVIFIYDQSKRLVDDGATYQAIFIDFES